MLRDFFIYGFVVLPLVIAVLFALYRARFFILGIAVLSVVIALIWGVLKLTTMPDGGDGVAATPIKETSCRSPAAGAPAALACRRPDGIPPQWKISSS